jgi:hypothetical protein
MMLDSCAALIVQLPVQQSHQAQLTFAMARHAAVDLALIANARPVAPNPDRFQNVAAERIADLFGTPCDGDDPAKECLQRFTELRETYESFMQAIANHFVLTLPPIAFKEHVADNWQRSKWMPRTPGIGNLPAGKSEGDHFG